MDQYNERWLELKNAWRPALARPKKYSVVGDADG